MVTEDQEAKAGEDYEHLDEVLEFQAGEESLQVEVFIIDDDNWQPDEDFLV